jgi:hypothetical protein
VDQDLFSFGDLILVAVLALLVGAACAAAVLASWVRESRRSRQLARRHERQAADLLRMAEQSPGGTDAWDADLLRRVSPRRAARARVPFSDPGRSA